MAWLEIHQSLINHRKTLKAAALLHTKPAPLIGHIISFWLWSLDNSPSGSLDDVEPEIIAFAAQWDGDPVVFVDALTKAGFLDDNDGVLSIHDWWEYAGKLIGRRVQNRERMCNARAQHVRNTCDARAPATVHNTTQHNSTVPNTTQNEPTKPQIKPRKKTSSPDGDGVSDYSPEFCSFWDAYPRGIGKVEAFRCWNARLSDKSPPDDLISAAKHYAAYCGLQKREARYIMHASTFLGPDKHYLEYVTDYPREVTNGSTNRGLVGCDTRVYKDWDDFNRQNPADESEQQDVSEVQRIGEVVLARSPDRST